VTAIPAIRIHGESCHCVATLHIGARVCDQHTEWKDPFSREVWHQIMAQAIAHGVHIARPISLVEVNYEYVM
jgi:hypothetical protein